MALMRRLLNALFPPGPALTAGVPSMQQLVVLEPTVALRIRKYAQKSERAHEAGGQLFGSITTQEVRVSSATGPYPGDERSRYGYRSDPEAAQRAIARQSKKGNLYLGEWHTHAEDSPHPSGDDVAVMLALRRLSRLNSTATLLLIVGRLDGAAGLSLSSFGRGGRLTWTFAGPGNASAEDPRNDLLQG